MSNQASVNNFVAHRIRQIRVERGLASAELAMRAGIPPGSYSCLENGWYRINLDNLFKILQALAVKVTDVWPKTKVAEGPINPEQVRKAIREAVEQMPRPLSQDDIFEAVCRAFEAPKDKLLSGSRWERLQEARAVCGMLAKELGGIQLRSLAQSMQITETALSQLMGRMKKRMAQEAGFAAQMDAARQILLEAIQQPSAEDERKAS